MMAMPRATLLLIILTASTTTPFVSSSSVVEPRSDQNTNRWLTYGCNSHDGGRRHLLSRILTHPCNTNPQKSTANDLYNNNTTRGSNTFVNVTLGILAGITMLLGLLFLIDRETFTQLTGVKEVPYYCNCSKPRIDGDDDDGSEPTPFEKDNYYLTEETRDYLAEKEDEEVEQPKRRLRSIFWCCFKTKDYDGSDKYNIPWNGSEDEGNKGAGTVNIFLVFWEDVRLRLCWRPTKEYSPKDKYDVNLVELPGGGKDGGAVEDEIGYAASSYESAEAGTAPW